MRPELAINWRLPIGLLQGISVYFLALLLIHLLPVCSLKRASIEANLIIDTLSPSLFLITINKFDNGPFADRRS